MTILTRRIKVEIVKAKAEANKARVVADRAKVEIVKAKAEAKAEAKELDLVLLRLLSGTSRCSQPHV